MKKQVGIYNNSNTLLVEFAFTMSQLKRAAKHASANLRVTEVKERETHELFRLEESKTTSLTTAGVTFPFTGSSEKNPTILFMLPGDSKEDILLNAGHVIPMLEKIEQQVLKSNAELDAILASVTVTEGFAPNPVVDQPAPAAAGTQPQSASK